MLNFNQSLLHPDKYRFGIKSPVLLYSSDSDYYMILITTYNSINSIDQSLQLTIITQSFTLLQFYNWKLHFVNRYCFCNTELRTAIITKKKGLLIQTQQNMFVLFTLFKLTSDEHKTLTKISTCKTSHSHSPKPVHASDMREQENQQTTKTKKRRKGSLHNWWRTRSIRISSENTRKKKRPPTRGSQLVLYKNITLFPSHARLTITHC